MPNNYADIVTPEEMQDAGQWLQRLLVALRARQTGSFGVDVRCVRQQSGQMKLGRMVWGRPLCLGGQTYDRGLGTYAESEIVVRLPRPGRRLTGLAGIDDNPDTRAGANQGVVFSVEAGGRELWRSAPQKVDSPPAKLDVDLAGQQELTLRVFGSGSKFVQYGHSDWVNLDAALMDGSSVAVDEFNPGPFLSFSYNGRPSTGFLGGWDCHEERLPAVDGIVARRIIRTDPLTKLQLSVEIKEYTQFPVVEWMARFKNTGSSDTPIIEDIQSLDINMILPDAVLHYHSGDKRSPESYAPHTVALSGQQPALVFTPEGGRSTNQAWPYYNIEDTTRKRGLIIVVGWPGQWASHFTMGGKEDGAVRISAGQELTHLKLHPGEEIRTPLSVLMSWRGDRCRSQNLWRRWMLACNLPRPGGKNLVPVSGGCDVNYFPNLITSAAGEKEYMDRYLEEDLKPDWWWHDAGWYINDGAWRNTGTWEVDRQRYPDGLRGINDYAHSKGMKTIVWFEPERVEKGAWLAKEHPGWILWTGNGGTTGLLDLGNPEAWNWLVNHIDKFLAKEGIDHYRQDFNINPLEYWRTNDAEDRQGITEIKHVTGYLTFWDELLRRHPGMLIDTCAAGGRRNDLETLRRSAPLWRSDYSYEPVGMQCQTYGLSMWVPYFGTGTVSDDPFIVRSDMAPFFLMCWDMKKKMAANAPGWLAPKSPLNTLMLRKLMGEWRAIAGYYLGDYYPLTSYNLENDAWMAWQFDRPDLGGGVIQVFRRKDSPFEAARFRLRGLDLAATYRITNPDQPQTSLELTGKELAERGLPVAIEQVPQALTIIYRRQ